MRRILTLTLAGLVATAAPAMADTYKFVTGNDFKPFTDESLPEGGLAADIITTAYGSVGHTVEVNFLPWKRAERLVKKGEAVSTFPYVKTEARQKSFRFSETPVYAFNILPVVKMGNGGSITSFKDMKGKRTCIPVGWATGSAKLDKMIENGGVKAQRPRTAESCFKLVAKGRADFLVWEEPTIDSKMKEFLGSTDELVTEDFVVAQLKGYLMLNKKVDQDIVNAWEEGIAKIKSSGAYDQVVDKHMN